MTAEEKGLVAIAQAVRRRTPPQLEALIIVYEPTSPAMIGSIMAVAPSALGENDTMTLERARIAAQAFIDKQPNVPGFDAQS